MAIDDFSMVLELDPGHVNAAYARGAAENKRGNYLQAIEDYNMALQLDSKDRTQIISAKSQLENRKNRSLNLQNILSEDNSDRKPPRKVESTDTMSLKIQKMEQYKKMDRNKLLLSPSGGK